MEDIAFRVLAADNQPNFRTISDFPQDPFEDDGGTLRASSEDRAGSGCVESGTGGAVRGSKRIKDFRPSWTLACQAAGVPGLLFHDLRRTAVRNLRRAGVAESVIMRITGHHTRGVFERYNITDQSDTIEAGKMAEEFLTRGHAQDSSQITSQTKGRPN